MGRDKQPLLHHLLGLSSCLWLHPEYCAVTESSFRPNSCFSLVCILSVLWSTRRTHCYFERQLAWQPCWDAKSWSEGVSPQGFHGLHLILVAGVVALAPKSFFTVLRASVSLWISVCKMELAMVRTFEGALWWGWERMWVQIQRFPEASVHFGLYELQKPQCYLLTKHRIWRWGHFHYWWSSGFC